LEGGKRGKHGIESSGGMIIPKQEGHKGGVARKKGEGGRVSINFKVIL